MGMMVREARGSERYTHYAIVGAIAGTGIFSLQDATTGDFVIKYAPYIMLGLQLGLLGIALVRLRTERIHHVNYIVLWMVFLGWCLFTGIVSDMPYTVLQRSLRVIVPCLMLGLVTLADSRPDVTFALLCRIVAWLGSVLAVLGFLIYWVGSSGIGPKGPIEYVDVGPFRLSEVALGAPPFVRLGSLVGNPNEFALWLLSSSILTLGATGSGVLSRGFGSLVLVLQLLGLVSTYSRSGILVFLFGLLMYTIFVQVPKRNGLLRLVGWGLTFGLMIGVLATVWLRDSRLGVFDLNGRDLAWNLFLQAFFARPLVGVGFGASPEIILSVPGVTVVHAHSMVLAVLAETGIIGGVMFLTLWISPMVVGMRRMWREGELSRPMVASALALLMAYMVHQFVEANVLRPYSLFISLLWSYVVFFIMNWRNGRDAWRFGMEGDTLLGVGGH